MVHPRLRGEGTLNTNPLVDPYQFTDEQAMKLDQILSTKQETKDWITNLEHEVHGHVEENA